MNTEVKLVGYHDGKQGDLNDNIGFCRALQEMKSESKMSYLAQEFYHAWIEVFRLEDSWSMYFTYPRVENSQEMIDGYLIESNSFIHLWLKAASERGLLPTDIGIAKMMDESINHFTKNIG